MIQALIIDDERNCIEMLEWLLQTYCPDVAILATCNSGESGIEAISRLRPQLVFLDIEMPKMNGFDVLEHLKEISFEVVFTTAYDNFAVRAFKYAALNYLLKPIDPEDLQATIKRLQEKLTMPSKEQMDLLFQNLLNPKTQVERIALSTDDGLVFVQTSQITYCKAESNYTYVAMSDGKKILVAKTLKEIDETLSGKDFFRVHNSYLVNVNHILKFVRGDGGYIVMPDKTEIIISRSKKDEFFRLFAKF
ncbi:MAG: response regulator transcription factor [Saprospiraceae bacterium]|nr:response regulator transcription factor [Saprospiraceae bacterium]